MNRLLIIVAVASVCQLVHSHFNAECLEQFQRTRSDLLHKVINNTTYYHDNYTAVREKRPHVVFRLGNKYLDLFKVVEVKVTFMNAKKAIVSYQTSDDGRERNPQEIPLTKDNETVTFGVPDYFRNKIVIKAKCIKGVTECSFVLNTVNLCALCSKDLGDGSFEDAIENGTTKNNKDFKLSAAREDDRLAAEFTLADQRLFRLRRLKLKYLTDTKNDTSSAYDGVYKRDLVFEEKDGTFRFLANPLKIADKLEIGAKCGEDECKFKIKKLEYCEVCPGTTIRNFTQLNYTIVTGQAVDGEPFRYKVDSDSHHIGTRVAFKLRETSMYRFFTVIRLRVQFYSQKVAKILYVTNNNFEEAERQKTVFYSQKVAKILYVTNNNFEEAERQLINVKDSEHTEDGLIYQFSADATSKFDKIAVAARCSGVNRQEGSKCGFKILELEICAFPREESE